MSLILADARALPLQDGCVDCVVTSPPYWGLRSYGVDAQIGLEPTPDAYVAQMISVFREVRRVLKDTGVLFLNLGDSYGSTAGNTKAGLAALSERCDGKNRNADNWATVRGDMHGFIRPPNPIGSKQLVGIPWRVAFALQADGWYLRSDIIWSKPNPMPESVQGTHYSRHQVTIDEYERLSGLRYACECAGDAWAGDMPSVSEGEVSHRKAPLSAEPKRHRGCSCEGRTRGRAGEAAAVQPITIRKAEQSQIRGDGEGPSESAKGNGEVSGEPASQSLIAETSSTHEGHSGSAVAATTGELQISTRRQGQGIGTSAKRTEARRSSDICRPTDGPTVGSDPDVASGAVPLLQAETEVDAGSRRASQQGRSAHAYECGPGVRIVQFQEEQQPDNSVLVGCPGCPKCLEHHGYTFHLSAGRPTKAHEYLFLLSKSEKYWYDAAAIAEPCSDAMFAQVEQGYDGLGLKEYDAAGVQNPSSVKARIIAGARRKNEQSGDRRKVGFNDRWDAKERANAVCLSSEFTAEDPVASPRGRLESENWDTGDSVRSARDSFLRERKSDSNANGRSQQAINPESERRDQVGTFNNNPRLRPNLTRNRRTVWTIPTMPYAGAHFATMPEKLVEPCILAGCPMGGLVLDPFSGSGTVLAVAERLGRRGIGVDLNPAYHELAKVRTAQRGLRFAGDISDGS